MSIIDKMPMTEFCSLISAPVGRPAMAIAHFWDDQDRQKPKGRKHFMLAAVALHLALAVVFLIQLRAPAPYPEEVAIELVSPPAPPQIKTEQAKPEVKETPKPQPVQQRAIRKPVPHLDPSNSAAIAAATPPPSPQQAPPSPTAPDVAPAAQAAPPPTYLAALYAHLARYKHYPRAAQLAHIEGTALLRFTMDRQGKVLAYRIDRGSGHADLDAEVSAMIERAQPLPAPPQDMPDTMELVIPVQFSVH